MKRAGQRKLRHAAFCILLIGLFLLMPPLILLFMGSDTIGGVPSIVAYIFFVWLALIMATRHLSNDLEDPDDLRVMEQEDQRRIDEAAP